MKIINMISAVPKDGDGDDGSVIESLTIEYCDGGYVVTTFDTTIGEYKKIFTNRKEMKEYVEQFL